jgi:hypothetical protein
MLAPGSDQIMVLAQKLTIENHYERKTNLTMSLMAGNKNNTGSSEAIKSLYQFESDQVYDFWLNQPKVILIYRVKQYPR